MPTFDFDAARAERLRQREPITFTLCGEMFTCLPFVPFALTWGLVDVPDQAVLDDAHPAEVFRRLAEMIADMLVPADVDRWWALFGRKDEMVDATTLTVITETLIGVYAGRPTSPSTDSSDGRPTSGANSRSGRGQKASARSGN